MQLLRDILAIRNHLAVIMKPDITQCQRQKNDVVLDPMCGSGTYKDRSMYTTQS